MFGLQHVAAQWVGVSASKISQWVFSENCIAKNTCENLKFKKRTGYQYKNEMLKRTCFRDIKNKEERICGQNGREKLHRQEISLEVDKKKCTDFWDYCYKIIGMNSGLNDNWFRPPLPLSPIPFVQHQSFFLISNYQPFL